MLTRQASRMYRAILLCCWQLYFVRCFHSPTVNLFLQSRFLSVENHNKGNQRFLRNGAYNPLCLDFGSHKTMATTATTTTSIGAFSWFGGSETEDDGDNDEERDEIVSASLLGVSSIMDSMSTFKSSQRVGERANAILVDLSNTIVEGTSADGKVKVSFNGQQKPVGVQIDESYLQTIKSRKQGAEELGLAMTKAMQDAHAKSAVKLEEKLKSLYTDLGIES